MKDKDNTTGSWIVFSYLLAVITDINIGTQMSAKSGSQIPRLVSTDLYFGPEKKVKIKN